VTQSTDTTYSFALELLKEDPVHTETRVPSGGTRAVRGGGRVGG
jgi:hypothetical protein